MKTWPLTRINLDFRSDDLTTNDRVASEVSPQRIAKALRTGTCPADSAFDRFLSDELRVVSAQYWTPLAVAMRAAEWLDDLNIHTVVDIGSGAGKFCVAAALAGHCYFTGLEQRPRLVSAARELARLFEVGDRVSFLEGALGETPVPDADAYYLFNPFGENIFGAEDHLDEEVELSFDRYERDITTVRDLLRRAPAGTHVLTYNGFGGNPPAVYQEIRVDRGLPNVLRMWKKTAT